LLSQSIHRYFSALLVAFILSFVLQGSAKWTNNLFYALIALPGLLALVKLRGAGLFKQPLALGWLALLAWCLVPAVREEGTQFYKHIVYTGLFVFIVALLPERGFFYRGGVVRALFWMICFYIYACAAYAYLAGGVAFGDRVAILPGRMENVIYTSIWLVCALALALPTWSREGRHLEMAVAAVLAFIAVAFVLQTRTGIVGGVFVAGLWSLYSIYRHPRIGSAVVALLIMAMAVTLWCLWSEPWLASLIGRGDSYRTDLFRIMTGEWQRCGWVLGCGVNFHTSQTLPGGIPIPHPHNIFVALGLYTGGISLLIFLPLMAATLWQAWRRGDPWGLYLAAALLMLNFDGSKLVGNPDELWVLVLLPAAVILGGLLRGDSRAQRPL
jgi:hypothetical protein